MWLLGKGVQKSFVNCLDAVHTEGISFLSHCCFSIMVKHSNRPNEITRLSQVLIDCL